MYELTWSGGTVRGSKQDVKDAFNRFVVEEETPRLYLDGESIAEGFENVQTKLFKEQ